MEICFSPWAKWASRNNLTNEDDSGVYLIARFDQEPHSGPGSPFEKSIVYIGESSGGRLRGRWRSFERSAFKSKGRHRGGKRYRELFGGTSSVLYVSVLSGKGLIKAFLGFERCPFLDISCSSAKAETDNLLHEIDDLLMKYVERRLILLYSLAHGHRPACNAD